MLDFVITIGPATRDINMLRELVKTGATIFRLNFSHNVHEWYDNLFSDLTTIKDEFPHIKVLADISGPSLRIITPEQKEIVAIKGMFLVFDENDNNSCTFTLPGVISQLPVGSNIIFGEGYGRAEVIGNTGTKATIKFLEDFVIKHRMHLHTTAHIQTAALTEKDWLDLHYVQNKPIDMVALSFVQDRAPIDEVRNFFTKAGHMLPIVSKIETQAAMDNLDELVQASDWLMVARGDLALEAELTELPKNQERIIQAGKKSNKPVIVATQMLYSMVNNPMPSRAEINDIALAVRQGASGVMLSDETTTGKFPLQAVHYLKVVAEAQMKRMESEE
ncbi:MAG: hypothetical protein HY817_05630 [Candidatus Abawacabacteria bacterium]|nr:hypothetical protein [Candidatus Abawacabacteria bacterium]